MGILALLLTMLAGMVLQLGNSPNGGNHTLCATPGNFGCGVFVSPAADKYQWYEVNIQPGEPVSIWTTGSNGPVGANMVSDSEWQDQVPDAHIYLSTTVDQYGNVKVWKGPNSDVQVMPIETEYLPGQTLPRLWVQINGFWTGIYTFQCTGAQKQQGCTYTSSSVVSVPLTLKITANTNCAHDSGQCLECAYPYVAHMKPNCGCAVDKEHVQPIDYLKGSCYAWCNSNGSAQSYLDHSTSNFDVTKGPILCGCATPTTGQRFFRPAGNCPTGSDVVSIPDSLLDSTVQRDSGQKMSRELDTAGRGSAGSGGGMDSGTAYRVLDTILGKYLGNVGTYKHSLDSIDSLYDGNDSTNGFSDSGSVRDSINNAGSFGGDPGTLGMGLGNIWGVGDDDIRKFDTSYAINLFNLKDTVKIEWGTYLYDMNLSPWLKAFERLAVIIYFFPWFLMIATGKEGDS